MALARAQFPTRVCYPRCEGNEGGRGTISFPKSGEAAEAASWLLDNLSEEIRGCLRYAEECARNAKEVSKPKLREHFLEMERRCCGLPTAINLPKSSKALGKLVSDRYRKKSTRVVMREIAIAALACFLIAIMAAALIVQFVP